MASEVLAIIAVVKETGTFFVRWHYHHLLAILREKHHIHQLRAIEQSHLWATFVMRMGVRMLLLAIGGEAAVFHLRSKDLVLD